MFRALWNSEICRWILVPCASLAAFWCALYLSLLALLFGPFPKDLAEPTAAFLMSSSMVLAGAVVAPRWRLAVAVVLGTLGALPVVLLLKMSIVTVSAGAVAAIIFVAFWFHPGRARSSTRWVMMAAGIGGFACLASISTPMGKN